MAHRARIHLLGLVPILFWVLTLSGCGGDGLQPGTPGMTIQLAPTNSGDQQTAMVGSTLPQPLRVLVRRGADVAPGVEVTWSTTGGHVSAAATTTDAAGIATVGWTLDTVAGQQFAGAALPATPPDTFRNAATFSALASPGPPSSLTFPEQPVNVLAGRPFLRPVEVAVLDQYGNTATGFAGSITLTLNPGGSLVGTTSVPAVDGVARFTDLRIPQAGTGYTLTASVSGLPQVTTAAFEVITPGPPRLAFQSDRGGNVEIYSMDVDGSGVIQLTTGPASAAEPTWAPDATRIAFVSGQGIYTMNFDGTAITAVVTGGGVLFPPQAPTWSPDTRQIAGYIPGAIRSFPPVILVVNSDGSGRLDLAPPGAYPAWSPDGRIAFRCARSPGPGICVMNPDGTGLAGLTTDGSLPAWSPDGRKIAFVRDNTDGTGDVFVMNDDGTGVSQITHGQVQVGRPAWSPDGTRIAFASTRDGNWEIYVMNADGTGVTRLTNNPAADEWPSWSP